MGLNVEVGLGWARCLRDGIQRGGMAQPVARVSRALAPIMTGDIMSSTQAPSHGPREKREVGDAIV